MPLRVVVTPGDPRGIGPEVTLRALETFRAEHPETRVAIVGPDGALTPDALLARTHPGRSDSEPDRAADEAGGAFAAGAIERAVELALAGDAHAIVTAPLHKPSLHAAGRRHPGQTEMLRELARAPEVGMLMAAERTRLDAPLRVLLATTHIPLRDVPEAVTEERLVRQGALLDRALRADWGIAEPRIALCGLNPHASDGGLFGDEEARVFAPAVQRLRAGGAHVTGPLPADTVFGRALDGAFDAVVSPYHDVGMAAFKTVAFGSGVNVTIGLPFVRTSPDHGTAFDIAGTDRADATSMLEALRLARRLANKRFDTDSAHV